MPHHRLLPSLLGKEPTYLPKLLARILPTHSLQYLRTTWMLLYKTVHFIYVSVYYYVQPFLDCVVFGDLLGGKGFGHGGSKRDSAARRLLKV
jgi:hypothetical protein